MTFSFQNAESVTVEVLVVARRGDYAEIPVPSEEPTAEETPHRGARGTTEETPTEELTLAE